MMKRSVFALALALGLTAATHAEFGDEDYMAEMHGTLGKGEMKRLAAVLGDVDALLADGETTAAHMAGLATFDFVNGYASSMTPMPGVVALDIDRREDWPAGVTMVLLFADEDDRERFHLGLIEAFGAPDAACSADAMTNWQFAPERSATWFAYDYGVIEAQLTIQASDPQDANCERSTTDRGKLLVEADIEAFLTRLRDEPVPLDTAEALAQWLSPYTPVEINDRDECDIRITAPFDTTGVDGFVGFAGMNTVAAGLRPCGLEAGNGNSFLAVASFFGADMFSHAKFAEAADALFGKRYPPCSDRNQQAWSVSPQMSLILNVSHMNFSASIYSVPVERAGCDLEYRVD